MPVRTGGALPLLGELFGVAATLGAIGPLIVLALSRWWLGTHATPGTLGRALLGLAGVALMVVGPGARLDLTGVLAGLLGALASAAGVVLTRKWGRPEGVGLLPVTAWQLTAGGLLLLPSALLVEGRPPLPSPQALGLLTALVVIGTALAYVLWFRAVEHAEPVRTTLLARLSPATAVVIDLLLGHQLSAGQWAGLALVALSFLPERTARPQPDRVEGPGGAPACSS